ncbi:MAG: hypothetical protein WD965_01760 [Actinomycetota bacterium]
MSDQDEFAQPEMTPTLAETARRRADLHHSLIELEQTISRPAVGREIDWAKDVLRKLQDLAHTLDEHIEVTERPNGLYAEISSKSPRLAGKIQLLSEEHPKIREATTQLAARLEQTTIGEDWPLSQARDDLQRLLGRLVRHRQLGADLVWEAYNLDIGGIE